MSQLTAWFMKVGCILMIWGLTLFSSFAVAGGPTGIHNEIKLIPIFKSRNIVLARALHRISIGNPEIADIKLLPNNQLYILGKRLGSTNIMAWDTKDRLIDVIDIEVTHDLNGLKRRLHQFLPQQKLAVQTSQGQLVISGETSSLKKMNTAVELAQGFSDAATVGKYKSSVLNMMSIGGGHQVMLEVVIAEIQRDVARQFDVDFFIFNNSSKLSGGIASGEFSSSTGLDVTLDNRGFFAQYANSNLLMNFAFDIAKQNGLAKVLAEPTLTALSGQQAEFLSGGEFPIPVPSDDGTTIKFRDFGVGVKFVPTVLDSGQINLNLNVMVSELSNANSIILNAQNNGTSSNALLVPSIVKRTTATTVELADGQTIAISGLISDSLRENVDQIPGLGDIPILGQLFKSQSFRSGQTELVILVTPRLVRPFNKKDISLPTDGFVTPSDVEFYLLGKLSAKKSNAKPNSMPPTSKPLSKPSSKPLMAIDDGGMTQKYGHSL